MMKLLITILMALLMALGSLAALAAEPISSMTFTEDYAKAVRAALPIVSIEINDNLEVHIKGEGALELTAYLDNAYSAYKAEPDAEHEIIQRYVQGILEANVDNKTTDRTRIVPVVKDREWLEEMNRLAKSNGAKKPLDYVYEALNEGLVVFYVEDRPQSIKYLTMDDLKKLDLAVKDLRPLAVGNLKGLLPSIEVHGASSMFMLTAGGNYEASLLLFDSIWSGDQIKVDGEIVVAIPARDLLMITGSKAKAGLRKMRQLAQDVSRNANYKLTDALFVYRGGGFVRFR